MTIPVWFILYIALGLAVYAPCLRGTLIYDDRQTWGLNPKYAEWYRSLKTIHLAMSRWLSWASIYAQRPYLIRKCPPEVFEDVTRSPGLWFGPHIGNVAIHVCGAALIHHLAGFWAGALFVVHPWAVNAVGYLTGRMSVLSAVFGITGCLMAVHHPWLAALALVLAILSKEDAAVFILVYAILNPWWLVPIVLALPFAGKLFRWMNSGGVGDEEMVNAGMPGSYPLYAHFWTVWIQTVCLYQEWALGRGQSPHHGSAFPVPSTDQKIVGIVMTGLYFTLLLGLPQYRMALALFGIGPWCGYLVNRVHEQISEPRNYSSLFGLVLLVSMIPYFEYFAFVLILYFGYRTWVSAHHWQSNSAMWKASAISAKGDKSRAWSELGALQMGAEAIDWIEGERYARKALEINPAMGPARKNLAWCLAKTNRLPEAIEHMEFIVRTTPLYWFAWEELAMFYGATGRMDEAVKCCEEAVRLVGPQKAWQSAAALEQYRKQLDAQRVSAI